MSGPVGHPPPPNTSSLVLVTDDRDWIDRIRSGNTKAFEALFRLYVRPLAAFAFRYVQAYDAAIGVVEEVFARLWRGRHSWAFHGSVRANLFASAHRVALEVLHRTRNDARWHAGLTGAEDVGVVQREADAIETVGELEREATIRAAVSRMPARARTVAFMRWTDRLTRSDIATVMGVNVRTVHSLLTPASRAMRRRLGSATDLPDPRAPYLRDAAEAADRFPTIDPDRLEYALAAEVIPAESAQLRRDIMAAGGEPAMLDAMEAVWTTPRTVVEDLVDEDTAWRALARHLAMPHDAVPTEPSVTWRERLAETTRGARMRAGQQLAIWGRATAAGARALAQTTRERAPIWGRAAERALNQAVSATVAFTIATSHRVAPFARRARVEGARFWADVRTDRPTRRGLIVVCFSIALIAGGWIVSARRAAARHVIIQRAAAGATAPKQSPAATAPRTGSTTPAPSGRHRRHRRRRPAPKPS